MGKRYPVVAVDSIISEKRGETSSMTTESNSSVFSDAHLAKALDEALKNLDDASTEPSRSVCVRFRRRLCGMIGTGTGAVNTSCSDAVVTESVAGVTRAMTGILLIRSN